MPLAQIIFGTTQVIIVPEVLLLWWSSVAVQNGLACWGLAGIGFREGADAPSELPVQGT